MSIYKWTAMSWQRKEEKWGVWPASHEKDSGNNSVWWQGRLCSSWLVTEDKRHYQNAHHHNKYLMGAPGVQSHVNIQVIFKLYLVSRLGPLL